MKGLVSIVIPTRNSEKFLENCLNSIEKQSYEQIETFIVDGRSTDKTVQIAKKYNCKVINFVPKVPKGTFDASHKRNYGVEKSNGEYVYYLDTDMELSKDVISEAVLACSEKYDAVIIREDSFGKGVWAKAKNLQRQCYWGDDSIEAPRFFKKKVWVELEGLDVEMGGGGDDWDLYQKAIEKGYKVGRIKSQILHNEGDLKLLNLFKKRFIFGQDLPKYIAKRSSHSARVFLFRSSYFRHWKLFLSRPRDTFFFLIMRATELLGASLGIGYYLIFLKK